MATCNYAKNDGNICGARARAADGVPAYVHVCGTHGNKYVERADDAGHLPEGRCLNSHTVRRGRGRWRYQWCPRDAVPHPVYGAYCAECRDALERRARIPAAPPRWGPEWEAAFADPMPAAAGAGAGAGLMVRLFAAQAADALMDRAEARAPPPPPVPELGRLARDNQNVHTAAVNRATEDGIAVLLAVPVPDRKDCLRLVMHAWTGFRDIRYNRFADVWFDAVRWYNTYHCRTMEPAAPDKLYRRVFNGLTAYIERVESAETRTELYRRFFQEAEESVGMCCDGHIARLVNVLVGFDDAFRPPVSQGELIQNRIAALSALDVSFEERARQANAFFDEIALPAADRVAWIEALEV